MADSHLAQFIPAASAGIGLFAVGVANLILSRRSLFVRALATLGIVGAALAGVASLDLTGVMVATAKYLAVCLLPFLLLASDKFVTRASALLSFFRRPSVRYGLIALTGLLFAVGAVVWFERTDDEVMDREMAELEPMGGRPNWVPAEREAAATDRGTRIALMTPVVARDSVDWNAAEERTLRGAHLLGQVINHGGATDFTNCHGWVFTGGRYNLSGTAVECILAENGYQVVTEPEVGDVVIYRGVPRSTILHTAIVRYVAPGRPPVVEGKWGALGVFLHPADKCTYGTDYTFHRSERRSHLLAGLGGSAQAPTPVPEAEAE